MQNTQTRATWRKIQDPENWPELRRVRYSKNAFRPFVLDSHIRRGDDIYPVCYDRQTKEFFIFL